MHIDNTCVFVTCSQQFMFVFYSSEHEGSRRMKTELLVQMDGLAKSTDLVFVLAASNLPWFVNMQCIGIHIYMYSVGRKAWHVTMMLMCASTCKLIFLLEYACMYD